MAQFSNGAIDVIQLIFSGLHYATKYWKPMATN